MQKDEAMTGKETTATPPKQTATAAKAARPARGRGAATAAPKVGSKAENDRILSDLATRLETAFAGLLR